MKNKISGCKILQPNNVTTSTKVIIMPILFLALISCVNQNIFNAKLPPQDLKQKTPIPISSIANTPTANQDQIYYKTQTPVVIDNIEKTILNGKVYDISGNTVDDALITATSLDSSINWKEAQKTIGGSYVFKNAPVGVKIELRVTKSGWSTRTRTEILKPNINGDPALNVFEFGRGFYATDEKNLYAIQDEPEIVFMGINGKQATNSDADSKTNINPRTPDSVLTPNLTEINPNILAVELKFSEPVMKEDVENYFRILSTNNFNNKKSAFTIDKNLSSLSFNWAKDNTSVTILNSKPVLSNYSGNEAKYLIDFIKPFKDKNGKQSITGKTFRFSENKVNDFHVFSVKNQDEIANIVSIKAIDGISSNDTIKIQFSSIMDVISQTVPQALLASPLFPNESKNQLWAMNTNNINGNNATLLGFKENGVFRVSYVIGRLKAIDLQNANNTSILLLSGLGTNSFQNIPTYYGSTKNAIKYVNLEKNIVSIELTSEAFEKNDYIVLSTSSNIHTGYTDQSNNILIPSLEPILPDNTSFYDITTPAGKKLEAGLIQQIEKFSVDGMQKVVMVGN